jgi:hypothetical protein
MFHTTNKAQWPIKLLLLALASSALVIGGNYAKGEFDRRQETFLEGIRQDTYRVIIYKDEEHLQLAGIGTATHLSGGKFLTAGHVCEHTEPKFMVLEQYDGQLLYVVYTRIHENTSIDLCLVTTLKSVNRKREIVNPKEYGGLNEHLYVGGFPGGEDYSIRSANTYLEQKTAMPDGSVRKLQFMYVAAIPGISGSAAITRDGKIAGVAVVVGYLGLGIVPLKDVIDFLKEEAL